ncbi:uncharacterized oxidoreductase YuxG-like isoform X2 [Manduca sexta]|uniref:uncharacterized oxidoreductase YuxG-like isoform X2 n=1 Tax=Manduca sexta TaxID=7130 RepID=UPI00188EF52F|nr:uncharacterized oxidoreductase YuxG-like isoform X2 [Manduca sexta]
MYEVKDKVVLVTGGAAGIGAGVVQAFLEENAKHVAALDVDVSNGQALEREMTAKYGPGKIKFYKCDVTTNDLEAAYESILNEYGYIDVVVNNAGIMNDRPNVYLKEITINVMEPHYSVSGVRVITLCFGCTDTTLFSLTKLGAFDKETDLLLENSLGVLPMQKPESAVKGLMDAYKTGASASTWLITSDKPAEDISENVKKAYSIMSQGVFS